MGQPAKADQSPVASTLPFQLSATNKKPNLLDSLTLQKLSAFKEVANPRPADESFAEEETLALNKKKVKLDNNNFAKPQEATSVTLPMNVGYTQMIANPALGDRNIIYPSFNNIVDGNQQNFQMCFVPMNQNSQQTMDMNMPNLSYLQAGVQPFQGFSQSIKIAPMTMDQNNIMIPMTVSESTPKQEKASSTLEELMRETQKTLVDMLISQNKMLVNLKEKNDLVQDTLACLITEVNGLKQTIKQTSQEKTTQAMLPKQLVDNSREIATTETLLHTLYGSNQEFPYQLMFKNEFQLPLYRERNFKFTVLLTDRNGNQVKNPNKIPLTLAIYTSESSPKFVDVNTSGNKILKGMIDKDLVNGAVTFEKIQIKEVTSHFRNGWIFFVVYPKVANPGFISSINAVSAQMIKPLIVEKVVVKAKRAKLNNGPTITAGGETGMEVEDDADNEDSENVDNNQSTGEESQEIFTEAASDSGIRVNM